ncbi:MAG: hypothetical protein NXY59_06005 [Aigarchaeota archaeon]|nr:hypothetical protein [Candidatus Pelearchaeum maunauluense]
MEGGFILDEHGDIYAVKGLVHPPGRVVAVPKYVRSGAGYVKLEGFQEMMDFMRQRRPGYLVYDEYAGQTIPAIPAYAVRRYIRPSTEIPSSVPRGLARDARRFILAITDYAGSHVELGLSGSILLGLADAGSDMDLVVYGVEESRAVLRALLEMRSRGETKPINSPPPRLLSSRRDTLLTAEDWRKHERRKLLTGYFNGRLYTMKLVPKLGEYWERYGDRRCISLGVAVGLFRVLDDAFGVFTPNRLGVEVLSASSRLSGLWNVREVISMRSRFAEMGRRGETIKVCGRLEKVILPNTHYYRIFVGNEPHDYILPQNTERDDKHANH